MKKYLFCTFVFFIFILGETNFLFAEVKGYLNKEYKNKIPKNLIFFVSPEASETETIGEIINIFNKFGFKVKSKNYNNITKKLLINYFSSNMSSDNPLTKKILKKKFWKK